MKITFREPKFKIADENKLFTLIRNAFNQRRKRISNSLQTVIDTKAMPELFKKCGLTGEERAENLSLKNYVDLLLRFLPAFEPVINDVVLLDLESVLQDLVLDLR